MKANTNMITKLENNILYTKEYCPFCVRVRQAMDQLSVEMEIRDINDNDDDRLRLIEGGGKQQVPCLFFKDTKEWMYESDDIIEFIREAVS